MTKYLAYSFGELALIIVGILLAIEISEWNDERVHNLEQRALMVRLLDAVQRDRDIPIASMLTVVARTIDTARSIDVDFKAGSIPKSREYAHIMYRSDPRSIVIAEFAELRGDISDAEIAATLGNYMAFFSSVSDYYESNTKDILHQVSRQINDVLELRYEDGYEQFEGTFDEGALMKKYSANPEFRGTIFRLYLNSRTTYSGFKGLDDFAVEFIALLENKLADA